MNILVGADPELFLFNEDGDPISAHDIVPGTKKHPYPVECGAVQVDGTAVEFNIDPASSEDEFVNNINTVMGVLSSRVPFEMRPIPTVEFPVDYFDNKIPGVAKMLGCDPDFNAWSLTRNDSPGDPSNPMRTAGGHIHIGYTKNQSITNMDNILKAAAIARSMDKHVGIPSLLWDKDTKRRAMYGCAGAFRVKPYGMEYRVLSNAWLGSEELMRKVYQLSVKAAKEVLEDSSFRPESIEADENNPVELIINNSDLDKAKEDYADVLYA